MACRVSLYWVPQAAMASKMGLRLFPGAAGENPNALYACLNQGEACAPSRIVAQSILLDGDIAQTLQDLMRVELR